MRRLTAIASILLLIPTAACAVIFSFQDRMIFHPQPLPAAARAAVAAAHPTSELIELTADDGVPITAWLVRPAGAPADKRLPLLMYFGGNGQEVSQMLAYAAKLPSHAWLIVAYRGYGISGGSPSEAALFADALTFYDFAARQN
jgi:uncharacterized protein